MILSMMRYNHTKRGKERAIIAAQIELESLGRMFLAMGYDLAVNHSMQSIN